MFVQNLVGNYPRRWERTGTIVEVRQYHQYVVKIDGSGRLTLRNRQHLRRYTPFNHTSRDEIIESLSPATHNSDPQHPTDSSEITEQATEILEEPDEVLPPQSATPYSNTDDREPADVASEGSAEISPEYPVATTPSIVPDHVTKAPRALARLRPHNKPGDSESPPASHSRRLRSRQKEL